MKGMIRGSSAGLAAMIHLDTTIAFLTDRQEFIDLAPLPEAESRGYVWKRIFLRGKGGARS